MSLDLYVHTEMNVGVFLPGGHRGVLRWVQIDTIQIFKGKSREHSLSQVFAEVLKKNLGIFSNSIETDIDYNFLTRQCESGRTAAQTRLCL